MTYQLDYFILTVFSELSDLGSNCNSESTEIPRLITCSILYFSLTMLQNHT